jgi:hypothetical protein
VLCDKSPNPPGLCKSGMDEKELRHVIGRR